MNPKFDPAQASLTLKWTVTETDDGTLQVADIATEPPSDPRAWRITNFLAGHKIAPTAGDYALRYTVDESLQVVSMPVEMGEDGRHAIITAFKPSMAEQVEKTRRLLQDAPTDDEIKQGATEIVRTVLQNLVRNIKDDNGAPIVPNFSGIKPGFVHITECACAQCGDREDSLPDPRQGLAGLLGSLANLIMDDSEVTISEFGTGRAFVELNDDTGANVKVGFASHDCAYAAHYNRLLADQMREQIAAVELVNVREMVIAMYGPMLRYVAAVESLAKNFGVELPEGHVQPQA